MPGEDDVRLGRLVVSRGLATEEQIIEALRARSMSGEDLGAVLVRRGLVPAAALDGLRKAAKEAPLPTGRDDASTDFEISITGTREILARDQLLEALRTMPRDPRAALRELRRLAKDFQDTESGVRAEQEAKGLEKRPELGS